MEKNYDILDFSMDILGLGRLKIDASSAPDILAAVLHMNGDSITFPSPVHFAWMEVGNNGVDSEDEFEQMATSIQYRLGEVKVTVTTPEGGREEVFLRDCPDIVDFMDYIPRNVLSPLSIEEDRGTLWLGEQMVLDCKGRMRTGEGVNRLLDRIDALDHSFGYSDDPTVFRTQTAERNAIKAVIETCHNDDSRLKAGIENYWEQYSRPPFSMTDEKRAELRAACFGGEKPQQPARPGDISAPQQGDRRIAPQSAVPAAQGIVFEEDESPYYNVRTQRNADETDMTMAMAVDWNSKGEICTKRCAENSKAFHPQYQKILPKNKYIPMAFSEDGKEVANWAFAVANAIERQGFYAKQKIRLNVAGNGIYTFARNGITQEQVDAAVLTAVKYLQNTFTITEIRSGGQTGVDEAGIKAAVTLGLPAKVLAPKGWRFRDAQNNDISDERAFKARFNVTPKQETAVQQAPRRTFKEIIDNAVKAGKIASAGELRDGWALIRTASGKFNYSDENGHLMTKNWFDSATDFRDGTATVSRSGQEVKINTSGVCVEMLSRKEAYEVHM